MAPTTPFRSRTSTKFCLVDGAALAGLLLHGHASGVRSHVLSWVNGSAGAGASPTGAPGEFVALRHVLDDMRLYKSRRSRPALRRAAQIAVGAHRRAMRFVRPGRMEYEVMAEVLHEFRSHNADISYYPIVGGGANACVMHYRDNDQPCATATCCCSMPAASTTTTPRISRVPSRSAGDSRRRNARSTRWCWRHSSPPSTRCARETTGIIRTRPPCA
jgi:hypothetical protein